MYRFFETIRAENGIVQALPYHQERVGLTLSHLRSTAQIDLQKALEKLSIPGYPTARIRVDYDLTGIQNIDAFPYSIRSIRHIAIMPLAEHDYRFKYADRTWINDLVSRSGCDEIIMAEGPYIRDASIANLAFFNGKDWLTPDIPLLAGTMRQQLLEQGIIQPATIRVEDLSQYQKIRLINAMIPWLKSPDLPISLVRLSPS